MVAPGRATETCVRRKYQKLKMQLEHKLKHARVQGRCDAPESSRSEAAIRRPQRWGVRNVKGLGSELHSKTLCQRKSFPKHDVANCVAWASHWISRAVADGKLRGRGKGGRIKVTRRGSLLCR